MNTKRSILFSLLAFLMVMPIAVMAQSGHRARQNQSTYRSSRILQNPQERVSDKTQVVLLDNDDNDQIIIDVFQENAPKAFNAPGAPRFALIGKERKFYLGIGGYLKGTASFDFCNPIDNPVYFTTSSIPMNLAPGNGGLFQMSAATSNLFFNFVGMPGQKHQIGAYINFDFTGNNYGFSLTYAYLTYAGFMVGYNFSNFSDLAAAPPTIDMEGPSSLPAVQRTLANYTYKHKNWSFSIGIESPDVSYTTNAFTTTVNQRIPDIPAYIQYNWDKGHGSLRLSALLHTMQYRNLITNENKNKMGWGIQLSGSTNLNSFITAYYQGVYGKGISNIIQDTGGLGLDMTPDPDNNGHLNAVEIWGAYAGMQFNYTSKLFSSHTYSQVRNYADKYALGTTTWNTQYHYAQYLVNNLFWQATPVVQVGLEYIWGRKAIMNGERRCDNRIQTMIQFNF